MSYRMNIKTKSREEKAIRINGKYCDNNCDFMGKMFQGYGGWLGFEVDGCKLFGQLQNDSKGCIRCDKCLNVCKKQIEENEKQWIKEESK